jgi:hypothetical protein
MKLEISPRLWADNLEGQQTISTLIQSVIASAISLVDVSTDNELYKAAGKTLAHHRNGSLMFSSRSYEEAAHSSTYQKCEYR